MSIALVSPNAALNEAIAEVVKAADEITAAYWKRQNFTFAPAPTHEADFASDKWVKIWTLEERNGELRRSSIYAFIALQDNTTKALGNVKAGDIHMAATIKAPAKHARGNVFAPNFRDCLTEHGVVYLRH